MSTSGEKWEPTNIEMAHLRPTTTLESMDNVFSIIATRPWLFLGLGALCQLPMVAVLILYPMFSGPEISWYSAEIRWWVLLSMVVQMWPNAAIITGAFQTTLFPMRPLHFLPLMRGSFVQLPQLILTRMLARLLLELLLGASIASFTQLGGGPTSFLLLALGVWSVFAMIYFSLGWALIGPVVMIERRGFLRALARSMELMRLRFEGNLLGDTPVRRLLILGTFPFCVYLVGQAFVAGVSYALTGSFSLFGTSTSAVIYTEAAVDLVAGSIYVPWFYIAIVAIYTECRMRREALDIQVRLLAKGEIASDEQLMQA